MYFNKGHGKIQCFWTGSILDNEFAKEISPEINATTIQVGISTLSAILYMIKHPFLGVIEPEQLDTKFVLDYCKPYLGQFVCKDVSDQYQPKSD